MTEQTALRRQCAIAAYVRVEYRTPKIATEHFDAYDHNPKELAPEQRALVKQSYQIADDILALAAAAADEIEAQQVRDHGAANTGGAQAVAQVLRADGEEQKR